ncbi:hypothetical protein BJX76DRAFT_352271 [Aspergillus varians]
MSAIIEGRGPYGRPCKSCVKAKSKCVAQVDGDGCQRCHRLNKQCTPPGSPRKRSAQAIESSRIVQLESKLDSLTTLFHSIYQPQALPTGLFPPSTGLYQPPGFSQMPPELLSAPPALDTPISQAASLTPVSRDLEEALALFCSTFLCFCPFFYLPPGLSAQELRQERPFLLRVIMAVTARSMQERARRGRNIKTIIGNAAIVENQSDIDLLLGILTYVAWCNDVFHIRSSTLPRLMQITMSIVYALHLNEPALTYTHLFIKLGHSLEKGRAGMIRCFLRVLMYFLETDPMRWTPQMEQYIHTIEASDKQSGDSALATHVRLQRFETPPPISVFLTSVFSQCEDPILAHVHYAELSIFEIAHSAAHCFPPSPTPTGIPASPLGPDAIDCMWNPLAQSLVTLYRLSMHPAPDWNRSTARKTIDIIQLFDRVCQCLEYVSLPSVDSQPDDCWAWVAVLGRTSRSWVLARGPGALNVQPVS